MSATHSPNGRKLLDLSTVFCFTEIPNIVLDELASALSGDEFKILCLLFRRTLGFSWGPPDKTEESIATAASLSVETTHRILEKLFLCGLWPEDDPRCRDEHEAVPPEVSIERKRIRVEAVGTKKRLGEASNWICFYCAKQGNQSIGPDGKSWHLDHKIPRSRGGPSHPDNYALACSYCNIRKKDLTPEEFAVRFPNA